MTKTQYAVSIILGLVIVFGGVALVMPQKIVAPAVSELPIIDPSQRGQPTYANATPEDIIVTLPFPGAVTGKAFSVTGKSRGYWFFEASFPVRVLDTDGNQIAVGLAAPVGGEWMTPEFVEFKADIVLPDSYTGPATLVLENDNPSGLPENAKSVSMPIIVEY
jgi:hypothetical protein